MSKCIPFNIAGSVGFLCTVSTDFKCPKCEYQYHEEDYYGRLYKSDGLIYKKCKGCGSKMGVTTDYKGDVQVWLKEDEKNFKSIQEGGEG